MLHAIARYQVAWFQFNSTFKFNYRERFTFMKCMQKMLFPARGKDSTWKIITIFFVYFFRCCCTWIRNKAEKKSSLQFGVHFFRRAWKNKIHLTVSENDDVKGASQNKNWKATKNIFIYEFLIWFLFEGG